MDIYFTKPRIQQKANGYIEFNDNSNASFKWELCFKSKSNHRSNCEYRFQISEVKNIDIQQLVWISTLYTVDTNTYIDVCAWNLSSPDLRSRSLVYNENHNIFDENTTVHLMCFQNYEGLQRLLQILWTHEYEDLFLEWLMEELFQDILLYIS